MDWPDDVSLVNYQSFEWTPQGLFAFLCCVWRGLSCLSKCDNDSAGQQVFWFNIRLSPFDLEYVLADALSGWCASCVERPSDSKCRDYCLKSLGGSALDFGFMRADQQSARYFRPLNVSARDREFDVVK